ncbi:flippase [Sphingomonas gilva]|uniref:Flippase n=1 Tax=Sphingomonas gilva TaxID=2305907 RepID=A0A396RKR5_9SPHN|nr:flippase [Sphingomonas gilva]RHW16669.1 flippase [Sphingomonas gilva]
MSIAKNTAYNLVGKVLPLFVSIVTVPAYLHVVGLERYGVLSIGWLLLGYLGFLELGMGPSLQQRIAMLRDGSASERSDIFWTALWLNCVAGIVGTIALYLGAHFYFDTLDKVSPEVKAEIADAIPWLSLAVGVGMLNSVSMGAMKGRERFLQANIVSSSSSIAMALLPLAVAYFIAPRLDLLIAASLVCRIAAAAVQFLQTRKAVPLGPPHRPSWARAGQLLRFGGWMSVTTILTPLAASFDRLLIGSWLGAAAVSLYTVPFNLVSRTKLLPDALSSAIFPRFASIPPDRRDALERNAIEVTLVLMTPFTLACIVMIGPFLRIWIGDELGARAEPIAHIILAGWWANAFARVSMSRVQGGGRPDIVTKLLLVELPFYFATLYFLMNELGIIGAALAWSARAAIDPLVLMQYNGQLIPLWRHLATTAILVILATGVGVLMPYEMPLRWLILAVLLLVGMVFGWRNAPDNLKAIAAKALARRTPSTKGSPPRVQ